VKVDLLEGESLESAVRRFRKLIEDDNGWPIRRPKPDKKRQDCYQKPSVLRRQKRWLAWKKKRSNHRRNLR